VTVACGGGAWRFIAPPKTLAAHQRHRVLATMRAVYQVNAFANVLLLHIIPHGTSGGITRDVRAARRVLVIAAPARALYLFALAAHLRLLHLRRLGTALIFARPITWALSWQHRIERGRSSVTGGRRHARRMPRALAKL